MKTEQPKFGEQDLCRCDQFEVMQ